MRWFKNACAIAGLVLAGTVAVPTAAPAEIPVVSPASFAECRAGWFCVWQHNDGTGDSFETQRAHYALPMPIGGNVFNDQISSVWNRTNVDWCVYEQVGYGGRYLPIAPGWRGDIEPGYDFGDLISSLRPADRDCPLPD
ncbi:peptidase inhibitor family I36 protein [Kibdelosporangium aridum]|uniref:peptidase inhibitor family I36 protein n=1 Tax=Kibdelosporangium aridum TaxID=2030 RepID=UPI000A48A65C|nr:peptidase inhibitor family I36 protein [Kibdelosporangium aridum]